MIGGDSEYALEGAKAFRVAKIFDKDPECGWGLRGDPYLWNLLRAKMGSGVPPKSVEEFKTMVEQIYEKTTGVSVSNTQQLSVAGEEEDFVPMFKDIGFGASAGWISRVTWRERIIPILIERFKAECKPVLDARWMTSQVGPKRRIGADVDKFLRWVNRSGAAGIADDRKPICFKEMAKGKGCFYDRKHDVVRKPLVDNLLEQYIKAKDEAMQEEQDWADFEFYND